MLAAAIVAAFAASNAIFERNSIQTLTDFITFSSLPSSTTAFWMFIAFVMTALGFLPLALMVAVLLSKWVIVGRHKEGAHSFGGWHWARSWFDNEVLVLWMSLFGPALADTAWMPMIWRLLGSKIGKNVTMRGLCITETDLVTIGHGVIIEPGAIVQPHTLENRVIKTNPVRIGSGAKLGSDCCVLRGAVIGDSVTLQPGTLIMAHDVLPANSSWIGCPAQFHSEAELEQAPAPVEIVVVPSPTVTSANAEQMWAMRVRSTQSGESVVV